jgi:hypothetical protein
MTLPNIISYEVKISKTELPIPVVNGVHLHSIYNPTKEAESLIQPQLNILKTKNEVLVLGLGFGYHVNLLAEELEKLHGDDFKIIVIEPNSQVSNECISNKLINSKNVLIYAAITSTDLYKDLNLIHFLLRKPVIIAHPASFNLYQNYFKEFLTFEAPKKIGDIVTFIETPEIKTFLAEYDFNLTLDEVLYNEMPTKTNLKELDFLTLALIEMTRETHKKTSGQDSKQ